MKKRRLSEICLRFSIFLAVFLIGCKEKPEEPETLLEPPNEISDFTEISCTSATFNGIVFWDGGDSVTSRGFRWSASEGFSLKDKIIYCGSGLGTFSSRVTGLDINTKYYVSTFATNRVGTYVSQAKSFTTLPSTPLVSSLSASYYTLSSVYTGGNVYSEGLSPVSESGIYFSLLSEPESTGTKITIGKGPGIFSTKLDGLTAGNTYYAKAFATNSYGTSYGNQISFTMWSGSMQDIEGNIYGTILIGSWVLMAENLRTTKFNDGTDIPLIESKSAWGELSTPGYCWYNNDEETYKQLYGALYNWHSVNTGKLCPAGWHVPSQTEYRILFAYPSNPMGANVGDPKKMAAKWDWAPSTVQGSIGNDMESNNKSGFSALPAGYRSKDDGSFKNLGYNTTFWSASEFSAVLTTAWNYEMSYNNPYYITQMNSSKKNGYSVRCLKDL